MKLPIPERLGRIPRLNLGVYPTPIEPLERFQKVLGKNAPRIFIKRDDYTGPGFGGNKVRKLEYFLAQALADGCEAVITMGGIKSNHCRVTAAFCARLGLRCVLVLNAPSPPETTPASLFLDELYGAEIHLVTSREERRATMGLLAGQLRAEGTTVCEIPLGASTPLGALGYVNAMQETASQLETMEVTIDYIFHSSSSGGTQSGILAGLQLLSLPQIQVIGVSPDDAAQSISSEVSVIVRGIGELLDVNWHHPHVMVLDDYIGAGYGIGTPESEAAIKLLARTEGIVLDPTYSAKAMAGMIDWIQQEKLSAHETVLFWHTGGQLALFNS